MHTGNCSFRVRAAVAAGGAFLLFMMASPVSAQTVDIEALQQQIQALLQQVAALQQQLGELRGEAGALRAEVQALKVERRLTLGARGEDVRALQRVLATDPDIYPEGIESGFFGPLTAAAVKRFQARFDMEQVGEVGPQTREHINYILENGAGKSGVIPPGLLMKFKDRSVFESLPEAAKARCKAREKLPFDRVPRGIFALCDGIDTPENEDEDEDTEEDEQS